MTVLKMTAPPAPSGSLVWIKGLRGPVAQKWPDDMSVNASSGQAVVLARHPLSPGEFALALPILEQRYPPPAMP